MTPAEWLRAASGEPWWALPDSYVRVALTLVAMSDAGLVVTTYDHLAGACGQPRTSIRRVLQSLCEAGFCAVRSRLGRGGLTEITVHRPGSIVPPIDPCSCQSSDAIVGPLRNQAWTIPIKDPGPFSIASQPTVTVCESLADLGDRGGNPDLLIETNPDLLGQSASNPRARDQDLLRSDPDPSLISDLRTPTSRDLTRPENNQMVRNSDPEGLMGDDDENPPGDKPKRTRLDPSKIPDRAWAAADFLRHQVLTTNAAAVVGTRPWDAGWSWPAGSTGGAKLGIGDGGKTGLRLSWANEFRLLAVVVLKAMRNADQAATETNAWNEIARTVQWLFTGQPAEPRFVVESPDSLRKKWDRIQTARQNRSKAEATPRGADKRPDPQAGRELKKWGW